VNYGGETTGSLDSVVLRIIRRHQPRRPDERRTVYEEVWLREEFQP
jgi:hypothetical protein